MCNYQSSSKFSERLENASMCLMLLIGISLLLYGTYVCFFPGDDLLGSPWWLSTLRWMIGGYWLYCVFLPASVGLSFLIYPSKDRKDN